MFCRNCGNRLEDDDEFCPICGRRVKRAEKPVASGTGLTASRGPDTMSREVQPAGRRPGKAVVITAAVIIAALIGTGAYLILLHENAAAERITENDIQGTYYGIPVYTDEDGAQEPSYTVIDYGTITIYYSEYEYKNDPDHASVYRKYQYSLEPKVGRTLIRVSDYEEDWGNGDYVSVSYYKDSGILWIDGEALFFRDKSRNLDYITSSEEGFNNDNDIGQRYLKGKWRDIEAHGDTIEFTGGGCCTVNGKYFGKDVKISPDSDESFFYISGASFRIVKDSGILLDDTLGGDEGTMIGISRSIVMVPIADDQCLVYYQDYRDYDSSENGKVVYGHGTIYERIS